MVAEWAATYGRLRPWGDGADCEQERRIGTRGAEGSGRHDACARHRRPPPGLRAKAVLLPRRQQPARWPVQSASPREQPGMRRPDPARTSLLMWAPSGREVNRTVAKSTAQSLLDRRRSLLGQPECTIRSSLEVTPARAIVSSWPPSIRADHPRGSWWPATGRRRETRPTGNGSSYRERCSRRRERVMA